MTSIDNEEKLAKYRRWLRTNLAAFYKRCFLELNPGDNFVPNWHIDALAHQLEKSLAGENRRFIATVPPRSGKTTLVSVAYPAWVLGLDPTRRIVFTTYGAELANEVTDQFQRIMAAPWYHELFPATQEAMNKRSEYKTTANGGRLSAGMGGTITGRGGDILIIDDIMKAGAAPSAARRAAVKVFFGGTFYSRLDKPETGSIIVVQQRLHQDDFVAHLIELGGWNYLDIPAIAQRDEEIALGRGRTHSRRKGDVLSPNLQSAESLALTRKMMGPSAFDTQYLGQPGPADDAIIKPNWLRYWDKLPPREECRVVISLDTAGSGNPKSDYSVFTVWLQHGNDHYLVDVVRQRLDFTDLRAESIRLYQLHKPHYFLIENKILGQGLISDLRKSWNIHAKSINPVGDKPGRLALAQPFFSQGQVYLHTHGAWLQAYLDELLNFPSSRHDDQVDSTSQYFNWVLDAPVFKFGFLSDPDPDDGGEDDDGPFWDPMAYAYRR